MLSMRVVFELLLLLLVSHQVMANEDEREGSIRGPRRILQGTMGVCEGDCDGDADCEDDLICFHRNQGADVPGCTAIAGDRRDICIPEWLHPRPDIHDLPSRFVASDNLKPFPECWGDCDSDADCQGDLVCFSRGQGGDPIPGCRGFDLSRTDYCVQPGAETKPPIPNTFPNEYSWDYSMQVDLGYQPGTADREPTQAELVGARDAILNWVNDASNQAYQDSLSFRFDRTEVTQVTSAGRDRLSGNLRAIFNANTASAIPRQVWYISMLTAADGTAMIQNLKIAPPNDSIYNSVVSESRLFVALTPAEAAAAAARNSAQGQQSDLFD